MKSIIVVISWWSNCMGLKCLDSLKKHVHDYKIIIVQNGKSEKQKDLFRSHMNSGIEEVIYPENEPAEHFCVLEKLINDHFPEEDGIWFVDHDAFLEEPSTEYFKRMDDTLDKNRICLLTPNQTTLTNPAFWITRD